MPNDAKWGLLAGVVGVVVAAVLFFHEQIPATAPMPSATPIVSQTTKPPQLFGKKPVPPAATPIPTRD